MIKEVEVNNTIEELIAGLALDFELYKDIITGTLTSNGLILTLVVNRRLAVNSVRKVSLSYMVPMYSTQYVAEYPIGSFGPSDIVDETTEYVFDVEPVMTSIIHAPLEQIPNDTVTVRLFTYEANINTTYGTKTLSVPYAVSYPSNITIPESTDGWYVAKVLDCDIINLAKQYTVDDVVFDTDAYYICIADSIGNPTTDIMFWSPLTTEQEYNMYELGATNYNAIQTLIRSDILVTRYVKQKYILELLSKTNYKKFDDIAATVALEKIIAMREAAVAYLKMGNPIKSKYILDSLPIEINSMRGSIGANPIQTVETFTL